MEAIETNLGKRLPIYRPTPDGLSGLLFTLARFRLVVLTDEFHKDKPSELLYSIPESCVACVAVSCSCVQAVENVNTSLLKLLVSEPLD